MKHIVIIFLLSILITGWQKTIAQSHYEKGWSLFNENKLDEARDEFTDATSNTKDAANAWLSLALMNDIDKNKEAPFNAFKEFYALVDDPNPYLFSLWFDNAVAGGRGKLKKDRYEFIAQLTESPKINATIKAKANSELGYHYEALGNFKKADEYFSKIGAIMEWQLAGNFENISGSGFDKEYAPIEHPENDYEFTNRNGAPVKWFNILRYRPSRWIHPGYHSFTNNSIVYFQTFVQSQTDQEAQIRIGVSGSVKVWVNDNLLFQEEDERNNGIDSYIFTAKLKRGYNRILVQLGQSDDVDDMNFLLRITDDKGTVLPLPVSANPKPYTKDTEYKSKTIPQFSNVYFEKLSENDPSILNLVMMANSYLANDMSYEARKVLNTAQEKAPNSSFISNQLMNVYMREDSQTLLSLELEKVKKNDPDNPLSLELLFNEAIEKEDYEEAASIVDKIEDIFGPNEDVYSKRIELLADEDKQKELFDKIREAYKKYPENWEFVNYMYLVHVKVDQNYGAGLSTLKKYLKKNYNTSAYNVLANHYKAIGNTPAAISIFNKLLENEAYKPNYYGRIASIFYDQGNYKKANEYYFKLIDNAPYVGYYLGEIAKAYKEMDDDLAEEYFEKALILAPNDFELRRIYRKYMGKKAVFDYFEEPDLYELYDKSESADDYPEDNSLIILDETQKVVYERGGSEEKNFLLVKVFNSTGIDMWKEYNVGYADIIKAEVLKSDGSRLKAETNGGHIVFTNLEENDAILLIYKREIANYGRLMKEFWGSEYFNIFYPYNHKKFTLMVQGDRKFTYKTIHSDMQPIVSENGEFKVYTWERKDQESIKEEPFMVSIDDFSEVMHFSSLPDWNWVNKWYYDISTTKAKSDYEVQEVTKELLKGKENLSDREKIHLIYDYVVKNIHYSSVPFRQSGIVPQKASKVINTKVGDCKDVSTLFVAMCRQAGYKAEIVLVNTRDNGEQELALPSIGFNHAIAKVYVGDTYYIVELTSDFNSFSTMGRNLKKSFVLEINGTDSKPYLLDSPTRLLNAFKRTNEVSFNESEMTVERTSILYGDYAAGMRGAYRDIGKKKREKKMLRSLSDDFAKVKLIDLQFDSTIYTTADSVVYTTKFTVSNCFSEFNGQYLLKIPFTYKQEPMDFLNDDDRKYPLAFWKYINDDFQEETVVFNIPNGYYLVATPENKIYNSKYVDYALTFKRDGDKLIVTRKLNFKIDVVPVEDFKEFVAFYTKVIKADETQIGFKKR
jgi:tetratricopeptide (TPR) repeat protein